MKKIICFSLTILILVIMAFTFAGCSKNCDCKHQIEVFTGESYANKWLSENDVEIVDIEFEYNDHSSSRIMIEYIDHSCGK